MSESQASPERTDILPLAGRAGAVSIRFSAGERLYRPGDSARGGILVASGRGRVTLTADTGREVMLYRLGAGEVCLLTTSALISSEDLIAEAVAETEVEARLIPRHLFDRLLAEEPEFRREVLRNYAERVTDLVLLIQDALLRAPPERPARLLLERSANGRVDATHQAIAGELGTAREVVTRALLSFEREDLLEVERGHVRVLNREGLERHVGGRV